LNVSIETLLPTDGVALRRFGAGTFDRARQGTAHKFAEAQALLPGDLASNAAKSSWDVRGNPVWKPTAPVVKFGRERIVTHGSIPDLGSDA
jgi:hypothetical protein